MRRLWVYLPSWPAKGPLFTTNIMEMVGSSISTYSSTWGSSREATVSPTRMSGMPARAMISPAEAWVRLTRVRPSKP